MDAHSADVRAYFDRPGNSNGLTEAINGRLDHLCGSIIGFRNLTHYVARSLLGPAASDPTTSRIVKSLQSRAVPASRKVVAPIDHVDAHGTGMAIFRTSKLIPDCVGVAFG